MIRAALLGASHACRRLMRVAGLLCLLGVLAPSLSFARNGDPLLITLAPRDAETAMAIQLVKELKQEPAFANISFNLFPWRGSMSRDVEAMARSDLALVHIGGAEIAQAVAPAVAAMKRRNAKAYAFDTGFGTVEAEAGLIPDDKLVAYGVAGSKANWKAMIRYLLARDFNFDISYDPPVATPTKGLWNWRTGEVFTSFSAYRESYLAHRPPQAAGFPFVAIAFNRSTAVLGMNEEIEPLASALEKRGLNVVAGFGYPSEVVLGDLLSKDGGGSHVEAAIGIAFKFNNVPDRTVPILEKAGVPIINAMGLLDQTVEEWEASPVGLPMGERNFQIVTPEFAGLVAPTLYAGREEKIDPESGLVYVSETPIPERIEQLAERAARYVRLRRTPNAEKHVAVIYYNYPAGEENVGASYLNVLPESLWQVLTRLAREGYDVGTLPASPRALGQVLRDHAVNTGFEDKAGLDRLVKSGEAVLLPVSQYRQWFDGLDKRLTAGMTESWGAPETSDIMTWRDSEGVPYFVFPAHRFGNILLAPQPVRGREELAQAALARAKARGHDGHALDEHGEGEHDHDSHGARADAHAAMHSSHLPPHHQYTAFYLWLQKRFGADAMVHMGTHATHEWLPGKEVGFTAWDPSEVMMGAVPQFYPYIVDDIGEGLQAKRRGMAALISYMTPPFDVAGLSPDLRNLEGLLNDYRRNLLQSPGAAQATLMEIARVADALGILRDVGLDDVSDAADVDALGHYLEEVGARQTPFGLHTLGVSPDAEAREKTAEAILSIIPDLDEMQRREQLASLDDLLARSGPAEMDALVAGLSGRYIAAGPGNDPIRNPDALPTGRNLYGFDPRRMPTRGTWEQGQKLADAFVADYRARHAGAYPDRLTFILWSAEAMRHEGAIEAEIMALMGVRPKWNARGQIEALTVIPLEELGRPRVDVTMVPSGLYRDTLPNLMRLFDDAVTQLLAQEEGAQDNPLRANWLATRERLEAEGVSADEARRIAAVRLFTEPPGAYGTGVENMVGASNLWTDEKEVADVYFKRVGYLFGQGYWGARPVGDNGTIDVFKRALSGSKALLHGSSSNLYGVLDNDDVLQYFGGTAMAIRQVDGATPDTFLVNLANPVDGRHETLEKYLSREMRARYLNPKWIGKMLDEGYAGSRFIAQTVDYLWGWDVTTPDVVDDGKWQQMYETYILDKHGLKIEARFRGNDNLKALQAMADRMLTAINKGYWDADSETRRRLAETNRRLIAETGRACDALSCSSDEVLRLDQTPNRTLEASTSAPSTSSGASAPSLQAPATASSPANPSAINSSSSIPTVEGFAIEPVPQEAVKQAVSPNNRESYGIMFALALTIIAAGAIAGAPRRKGSLATG